MDNNLIDREILSSLVDELIKKKPLAVNDTEELNKLRESAISSLDDKIGTAIFSQCTREQNEEYHRLINREDTTEQDFADFFNNSGIDLEQTITDTMQEFAKEFLGGENE